MSLNVILIGEHHDDLRSIPRYLRALEQIQPDNTCGEFESNRTQSDSLNLLRNNRRIPYIESWECGLPAAVNKYNLKREIPINYDYVDPLRLEFLAERENQDDNTFDEEWQVLYTSNNISSLIYQKLLTNRWENLPEYAADPQVAINLASLEALENATDEQLTQFMLLIDAYARFVPCECPPPELLESVLRRDLDMSSRILRMQGTVIVGVGRGHVFGT